VVFAQWDQANVALGVAMFGLVWSGIVAGIDRYSSSSIKRRQAEVEMATKDCHERLAEKDRQIDRLEKRVTSLERENERLAVLSQNPTQRPSLPSSGSP
jgi:Na+/glutamate symporter